MKGAGNKLTRILSCGSIYSRLFIKDQLYIAIHFDLLLVIIKVYLRETKILNLCINYW